MSSSSGHRLDSITGPPSSKQIRSHREGKEGDLGVGEQGQWLSGTLNPETRLFSYWLALAGALPGPKASPNTTSFCGFNPLLVGKCPFLDACQDHTRPSTSWGHLPPLCKESKEPIGTEMALTGGDRKDTSVNCWERSDVRRRKS